ncbi:E4 SUMO-protein ligase PIAL2 isoform X3 [Vigna unguiculata]|nr:E4 SUMO-protein ligase PIAL2 isoform X3 [Vigna unguiculata]
MGSINATRTQCNSEISTIMEKFYPNVKLGSILASIEAQPGYGASLVDFHITKSEFVKDKIFLLVAQLDNIEISACLISPPQVNFLLNGKGVANRTYVQMDPGPQMPTDVTGMLKFGTNLLQAVGQFNGRYIVLVAYMSFTPLQEDPVLQDYLQPVVTSIDSDSDIIEGASQISLNCPISFTRIKTPVKGRSCKHFQCFDFNNFISINSKRPSWRCPHCNQYVCYGDIRLDRNMVEILKNVGESITEVIVLADGSWKAVLEKDHDVDKMQKKAPNHEKEQTEPQEYTCSPATVDLTEDDDHVEAMDSSEIVDRKPPQASVQSQFVAPNSTSLGMNTPGVNRNVAAQLDDFLSGVYIARSRSDTPMVNTLELPVLPDSISPAFNQESAGRDNNPAVNSAMRNQISAPNNLPMQMNHMNSVNEYGRSSSGARHINRSPVAVQALPVQSQALGPQQNPLNLKNSLLSSNSSSTSHISLPSSSTGDTMKAILSDTERQQRFSRSPMNLPQVSGVNSPAFRHHPATQNRVPLQSPPTSTPLQNTSRPGSLSDFRNQHLQHSLNRPRQHPTFRPSTTQWSHIQQGVPQSGNLPAAGRAAPPPARQGIFHARNVPPAATTAHSQQSRGLAANQPPPRRTAPLVSLQNQSGVAGTPFATDSFHGRGNTAQSVSRPDELFSTQAEQNWAPTGRMRGSLDLSQPFDESIAQRIITPTQTQSSRPPPLRRATGSTQQDVLTANNRNANAHNRPST